MKEVGKRIKELRTNLQMTQPQLAEATKIAQSTLSELEGGASRHPSALSLVKLAKFFEVDIEWLLTGKGSQHAISSMTEQEAELLILFRSISPAGREYVLSRTRDVHQDEHQARSSPLPRPGEPGDQEVPRKRFQ